MTDGNSATKIGGIVLCGGQSRRMGQPKLSLPFGPLTMLEHIVGILREVVSPIVVVGAKGQQLPGLPVDVIVARDEHDDIGPLGGLSVGLSALGSIREAAFAVSCDMPLLKPAFIRSMIESLESHELAIPRDQQYYHPLAAVYRTSVEQKMRALIAQGRMRPVFLLDICDAKVVDVEELRAVDAELSSLRNANTLEDYQSLLLEAGFAG